MKPLPIACSKKHRQSGFLMLEVLITIVILAFGLLGLAGLQTKIQTSETESYQRVQALLLVEDMVNRLSANRTNAADFVTDAPLGMDDEQPDSCADLTGVALDQCEWSRGLKGAAEKQSSNLLGAMAGARGCIEQIAGSNPPVFRVSVAWQGMTKLSAPSLTCGQGEYGADGFRRVIAGFVTIADLDS
ncbi:type IV pilus modification protein PilV [Propionivibrio limicola]|uniref:type IV pilus modification protein PilV n=1 Tax=Propionivibrio limicola TaxID=167645 RepID=UPI00129199C6|nr:type IV pilus modification protein PilV [Propionivibrio limicola]